MKNKISIFINYTLVISLIAISGFPVISQYDNTLIIILLTITCALFVIRKKRLDLQFILFLSVFGFLTYIQLLTFNVFPVYTLIGLFSKIIVAYTIAKVVNKSFLTIYINVLVSITIISFIFWLPSLFSRGFSDLISNLAPFNVEGSTNSYLIYHPNFGDTTDFARNSGPFWEPGAFAGFLMIALFFNHIQFPSFKDIRNIILILGILSTFSTTAYIAFFLFILFISINYKGILLPIAILIVVIPISIIAFQELPFLKDKLTDQIDRSGRSVSYTTHRTRFTSALIDLNDFQEYPIAGRGKFEETRFSKGVKAINRNNGTTDLLVIYGLIGFSLYFIYYVNTFKRITMYYNRTNKSIVYYYVIIILVLGFSENYFLLPFFWSICFVGFNFEFGQLSKQL